MSAREELASLLLPQRIEALIKRAGLSSQEQFGLEIGVERPRVNAWLRGRSGISPENGQKIATYASRIYGEELPADLFTSENSSSIAALLAELAEQRELLETILARLPPPPQAESEQS